MFCIYKLDGIGEDHFPSGRIAATPCSRGRTLRRQSTMQPWNHPMPSLKLLEGMPSLRVTEVKVIVYIVKVS